MKSAHLIRRLYLFALVFFTPVVITTMRGVFFSRVTTSAEVKKYSIDEKREISSMFETEEQNDQDLSIDSSEVKNYLTDEKRDIYSTFDTEDQIDQGLPIDPFDLMNRLKQIGSMDDATTPSDALDEALNAFDQSENEIIPIE